MDDINNDNKVDFENSFVDNENPVIKSDETEEATVAPSPQQHNICSHCGKVSESLQEDSQESIYYIHGTKLKVCLDCAKSKKFEYLSDGYGKSFRLIYPKFPMIQDMILWGLAGLILVFSLFSWFRYFDYVEKSLLTPHNPQVVLGMLLVVAVVSVRFLLKSEFFKKSLFMMEFFSLMLPAFDILHWFYVKEKFGLTLENLRFNIWIVLFLLLILIGYTYSVNYGDSTVKIEEINKE